jgi:glycosyl-4,4'-diaponeurosporenoate acyltransferase
MDRKMSLPMFQLPNWLIFGLCVVGWLIWSVFIGFIGYRLSLEFLETDTWLTQTRFWEQDRHWYEKILWIKGWKDWLPEAGGFFQGGFSKNSVSGGNCAVMSRFLAETRRAEYVHTVIWLFWLVTILWTPIWGILINLVIGTAFNLPCLLVQRYNRLRLKHLLILKGKEKLNVKV